MNRLFAAAAFTMLLSGVANAQYYQSYHSYSAYPTYSTYSAPGVSINLPGVSVTTSSYRVAPTYAPGYVTQSTYSSYGPGYVNQAYTTYRPTYIAPVAPAVVYRPVIVPAPVYQPVVVARPVVPYIVPRVPFGPPRFRW